MIENPFITYGYESAEYFCDRKEETEMLTSLLTNGNHVALISPRRMGKTGLIRHTFSQELIQNQYYTFLIDIYATKNLQRLTVSSCLSHLCVQAYRSTGKVMPVGILE